MMQLACVACKNTFVAPRLGQKVICPGCHATLGPLAQLEQALALWYAPRRWRADLVEPNIYYLIERLWTADGQGERLFHGISPKYANYDVFRHLMTRLIAQGVEEGWAVVLFPEDPLVEDPTYRLEFRDPTKFADAVEALFPEVDWDEQVSLPSQPS